MCTLASLKLTLGQICRVTVHQHIFADPWNTPPPALLPMEILPMLQGCVWMLLSTDPPLSAHSPWQLFWGPHTALHCDSHLWTSLIHSTILRPSEERDEPGLLYISSLSDRTRVPNRTYTRQVLY